MWVTKYRRAALAGEVGTQARELLREICAHEAVVIIKGQIAKDPVQLFVALSLQVTIRRLVQRLKGKTAYKLLHEYPDLHKKF